MSTTPLHVERHWFDRLTARELEVLDAAAAGWTNVAIADHLGINVKTVEAHVGRMFRKLGLFQRPDVDRRVVAAVSWALWGQPQ